MGRCNDTAELIISSGGGGGGANTTLSNLGTTSINSSLIPVGNVVQALGTAANAWGPSYIETLLDSSSSSSVNVFGRVLIDLSAALSYDWNARILYDNIENPALSYDDSNSVVLRADLGGAIPRKLLFNNEDDTFAVEMWAATGLPQTVTFVLPQDNGTAGAVLQTDGSGFTSWNNTLSDATVTQSLNYADRILYDNTGLEILNYATPGSIVYPITIKTAGQTGNQTINKISGIVRFAAAATTLTVTNSTVQATSIVMAVIKTDDTTATIKNVVCSSGSFVIKLSAAATAETEVGWFVFSH